LPLLPALYLAVLLALCAVSVWRPLTAQDDFWSHAAVGRWIAEHGRAPHETLFLWSASEPWVGHSWLSQLAFHGLTTTAPDEQVPFVVLTVTAALVAAPYLIVWRLWTRHSRVSTGMFLVFAVAVLANFRRYQTRPELFSILFLALLLAFLAGADGGSRRKTWLTAAVFVGLFALWANFHGGVLVGLAVLAATVVFDLLQYRFDRRARTLALVSLLAPAAVCLNPYGLGYWEAFEPLGSYRFRSLTEWWPVWKVDRLPVIELGIQAGLLLLALAAWALNPRRRWSHLAWALVPAALYASATRNVWLATTGSLLVLAANSGALTAERFGQLLFRGRQPQASGRPLLPPVVRWIVRLAVVTGVGLLIALRVVALREWQFDYRPSQFDRGIVQFLHKHQPPGRLFNDFESSRYLEYRLAGRPPLFIDAQMAYPDQVMRDYLDILDATPRSQELLDEHGIGYVILTVDRVGPRLANLADRLDADKRWKCVYSGVDGLIWVRRTPEYRYLWDDPNLYVNSTSFRGWERFFRGNVEPHSAFAPD
jgi:hypothetical protein